MFINQAKNILIDRIIFTVHIGDNKRNSYTC